MRRLLVLLLLALAVAPALLPDRSAAALYWAHGSSLGRANLDGSQSLWPLPKGWFPALSPSSPCGLAVDAEHLYWGDTTDGAVGRAAIDGTRGEQAFISGLGAPCGVAVDASHVYWSDFDTNMIGRANLDGSGVEPGFILGAADPCGVAVDGAHVYWTNQDDGTIGRANLDGSGVDQEFITGAEYPCGVAVGAGRVYWGDQGLGAIGRADLDGGNVEPAFVGAAGEPWDVDVNATHVFWADRWGTPADPSGGIGRAALDGGEVIHDLVPGLHSPTGVALDARLLTPPSTAPRPSDFLRVGPLKHNRDGSVQLLVYVPARGEFTVRAPRIGWRIDKGNPPPFLMGSFTWKLKLWPGSRTKAAKRIHRQLRLDGRAPIVLRIVYQQEGRTPIERTKRFAFQR